MSIQRSRWHFVLVVFGFWVGFFGGFVCLFVVVIVVGFFVGFFVVVFFSCPYCINSQR